MKRLHDLKKSLPSNARLNIFEKTRVKGGTSFGGDKSGGRGDRPSGGDDDKVGGGEKDD